jgi:N6-L-threonylcarbamoyladenine synthase
MHGDVDPPVQQGAVQFLGKQTLAADFRQRPVQHLITRGFHRINDESALSGQSRMRKAQKIRDQMRLDHGQRTGAGAYDDVVRVGYHAIADFDLFWCDGPWPRQRPRVKSRPAKRKGFDVIVLGIETSCDETAAAVVDDARRIRSNVVLSQIDDHRPFGGVVPEVAARAHLEHVDRIIAKAMQEAGVGFTDLDCVAATAGPGLIGGVLVGAMSAKAISVAAGIPFVAVNHLEGHALTVRLTDDVAFPYLLLLVSGGHCQLLICKGVGRYTRLGTTIDDAAGEAFDKTAKMLGLGYPGGPLLEKAAEGGDPQKFDFPRPMAHRTGCDFSFSGLKTSVRRAVETLNTPLDARSTADLAASFQQAVAETLVARTKNAIDMARAAHPDIRTLVVAGGVAANRAIGSALAALAASRGLALVKPAPALCTDNAAMIAWAGLEHFRLGHSDPLDFKARPRWPLDPDAPTAAFAGVKA